MIDPVITVAPGSRRGLRTVMGGGVVALIGLIGWWSLMALRTPQPAALRREAEHAAARGRWQEAGELSRRLNVLDPHNGPAWLMQARAAQQQGDMAEAARILAVVPADTEQRATADLALLELQLGPLNSPLAAEQTCRAMLQRDPKSAVAHQRLIFLYAITLRRQELIQQARRAMDLECEPIEAYVYLFFADSQHFSNGTELNRRWRAANSNAELFMVAEAVSMATALEGGAPRDDIEVVRRIRKMADDKDQFLAELFARYPQNLELLAWHLDRAVARGDVNGAVALLRKLPPAADDDNRFWRFAGWTHVQLGREERALASYQHALELHPLDWNTRHFLAALRRQRREFDEVHRLEQLVQAAHALRRALDVLPNARAAPPVLLEQLADYAGQCGDDQFARALRRHLQQHIPDHSPAS